MKGSSVIQIRFPFVETTPSLNIERGIKFDHFFQNIYYILLQRKQKEQVSFETVLISGVINFFIIAPTKLNSAIKSLVFAIFPEANVDIFKDIPDLDKVPSHALAFNIQLVGNEAYTLRTYKSHKDIDPMTIFFSLLAGATFDESIFFQIICEAIDETLEGTGGSGFYSYSEKETLDVEKKPKFKTTMRLLYFTKTEENVEYYSSAFKNVFSIFSTDRNRIDVVQSKNVQESVYEYFQHIVKSTSTLNSEEIASMYHLPTPDSKIRGINWLYSRRAEPPLGLPTKKNTERNELCQFAQTNFHGDVVEFGFKRPDRRRHLYILGKSGSGKSKLLQNLIMEDINSGRGVGVLDPHGDLVEEVLECIPENRIDDVVFFNSSDLDNPISFNPLTNVTREFKQQVTQGMIEIFRKSFGADWSPKIEHVFRYTILALLDYDKPTIMGMQVMLTDRNYRQMIIGHIQDDVVKRFWANEFSSWSEKFDNEAIVPLVNKLGQFLSIAMVRNIIAQPKNLIDFDDIMNNQRILLCEISKGKLGEENSALLGAMLITKVQQQGMARAFLPEEKRRDFYLYVDEFQNFATESFETLLSEARKYRLCVTVSHQYLGQLKKGLKDTIFGNTGSLITFRTGAEDAEYLAEELKPRFKAEDIMNLGVREIYAKMSIDGATAPAFSAYSMSVPKPIDSTIRERAALLSRSKYAKPVEEVEKNIAEMYYGGGDAGASTGAAGGNAGAVEEADFDTPVV